LPIIDREKTAAASDLRRGAYIIRQANKSRTDIILIATGSEVSIAVEAAKMLEKEEISARVVSMPSWELFEAQPVEYRESILPPNIKARIAIEAGIGQGWERYIGFDGDFIGMSGFGASAPAKILYEKFGITAKNIVERAKILISK
jgi:transketolase